MCTYVTRVAYIHTFMCVCMFCILDQLSYFPALFTKAPIEFQIKTVNCILLRPNLMSGKDESHELLELERGKLS